MTSTVSHFFFSSRRRHTRFSRDWSSDVCSSDLVLVRSPRPARCQSLGRIPLGLDPDRYDLPVSYRNSGWRPGSAGRVVPAGRGLWESAWRRINVGGWFYRGSVISPGVTTRVPGECGEASSARGTRPRLNGKELNGSAPRREGMPGEARGGMAEVDLGLLEFAVVD